MEIRKVLERTLSGTKCMPETEYYWPKGGAFDNEKGCDAAVRETLEETGLDISMYRRTNYFEDCWIGNNNIYYKNCLWTVKYGDYDWWRLGKSPFTVVVDKLPFVSNKGASIEISDVRWVHKDDLPKYLKPERLDAIKHLL